MSFQQKMYTVVTGAQKNQQYEWRYYTAAIMQNKATINHILTFLNSKFIKYIQPVDEWPLSHFHIFDIASQCKSSSSSSPWSWLEGSPSVTKNNARKITVTYLKMLSHYKLCVQVTQNVAHEHKWNGDGDMSPCLNMETRRQTASFLKGQSNLTHQLHKQTTVSSLFSRTIFQKCNRHKNGKPFWILLKIETRMSGWQWH